MSGPKDAANAALSAARRQNATLRAHDDARREVKDLLDHRATGQEPAKLRRRGNDNIYGCEAIRRLAPDHQHRFKDEAYCRELMALTTYRLRDIVQDGDGHWLRVGCERAAAGCVPLAPDGSVQVRHTLLPPHLMRADRRGTVAADRPSAADHRGDRPSAADLPGAADAGQRCIL